MAISLNGDGSFFGGPLGSLYTPAEVTVIHRLGEADEAREVVRGAVLNDKAYFEVTTPVYEGDHLVAEDPRGGTRTLRVESLKLNDHRGNPVLAGMSYSLAELVDVQSKAAQPPAPTTHTVYNGPVVTINGDRASVAWGRATIKDASQNSVVADGYEELAEALTQVLQLVSNGSLFEDEAKAELSTAATLALEETTKKTPDRKALQGLLTTVRGILSSAIGTAIGKSVTDLLGQLIA